MNAAPQFQDLWIDDLRQASPMPDFLWHGYLAPGKVTLLSSRHKSGKTTLLSLLLKRMETGGELAGMAVLPGVAYVVSEEQKDLWHQRDAQLHFGRNVCWQHRPFGGRRPSPAEWQALLDHILEHHRAHGTALTVIDTISFFLPARCESDATCVMDALMPLCQLTNAGIAVLLLHHTAKQTAEEGNAARGSTALGAFADFILEMHFFQAGRREDPRRRLVASSRFSATPPRRVIELAADGADYRSLGDPDEADFRASWDAVAALLAAAPKKLSRLEILDVWPPDHPAPADTTLWRWLERAVQARLVLRDGSGSKTHPFRYWLPGSIERWETESSPEFEQQKYADEGEELVASLMHSRKPNPLKTP